MEPLSSPLSPPLSDPGKARIRVARKGDALLPCKLSSFRAPTLGSWSASKPGGNELEVFLSTAKQCPCCSDPVRIRIDWNCIYSKSRPARKEHGSWADRCQRAAEQAGCDCVPGCEKKARDLTLVDKRYSTAGCSRCVGWTGLPSGLTTYTLVRWSTLGRAGSQVRFVHQRWRPKEGGSPGQVAPDFQPLASRAVTLQRGEGGWSFGDRYLAADSCAQTWILRDPAFLFSALQG